MDTKRILKALALIKQAKFLMESWEEAGVTIPSDLSTLVHEAADAAALAQNELISN